VNVIKKCNGVKKKKKRKKEKKSSYWPNNFLSTLDANVYIDFVSLTDLPCNKPIVFSVEF